MGAVPGIFSLVPCLCSGAPCLLCSCFSNIKNSTGTWLIYAFILLGTAVPCIMLTEGTETQMKKIPGFYKDWDVLVCYKDMCQINFILAIFEGGGFFFLLMLLLLNFEFIYFFNITELMLLGTSLWLCQIC
uniref:Uncharacterized protein n=1 Tax=Spermophilus dauricus TaxID=99837 RepID=A0A8C9P288_SPEDA